MTFLAVLLGFFLGAGTVVALAPRILLWGRVWRALARSRRWTAEASRTIEGRRARVLPLPTQAKVEAATFTSDASNERNLDSASREPDTVLGAPSRLNEASAAIATSAASDTPPIPGPKPEKLYLVHPLAWPWTRKSPSIFHSEIPS